MPTQMDLRKGYYAAMEALATGTYKGSGDVIDWEYYDTATLDAAGGVTEHRLFTIPRGQGGKGLAETNLSSAGELPAGQKLYVKAIKFSFLPSVALNAAHKLALNTFLFAATMNVFIEGKDSYGRWPLADLLGESLIGDITTATVNPLSSGRYVGILPLNLPIVLASQVSFSCIIERNGNASTALDDDKIRIGLMGILERLS